MARTGRRPGAGGTREKILAAARFQFSEADYEGATIRDIAVVPSVQFAAKLYATTEDAGPAIRSVMPSPMVVSDTDSVLWAADTENAWMNSGSSAWVL